VALIVAVYQRLSGPAVVRNRELRSDLNAQMAESISGMQVLQASNATARFREHFAGVNEAHYRSRQRELRANAWLLRPLLDMLNVLLIAVLIGVFGLRSQGGALGAVEVGILYAFMSYVSRIVEPLTQITMQFSLVQQAMVGAARVQALLKEVETPKAADLGRVTDGMLRTLYENAACFVFPSRYEGFGLPPLEAMSCGCPVVASAAEAVMETCGDAAWYCPPHAPEAFAKAVIDVDRF
jgi:ATP-binding cassette subfamily B protein/ATP-binding cassette subfamily C protein/ATP-binding cassette subfamily B multidrug efflux pump